MSVDDRRLPVRMQSGPVARYNDELDADQTKRAVGERFVDQRFRLTCVQDSVADATRQDEMHAHRARTRAAHARRGGHPAFSHRDVHSRKRAVAARTLSTSGERAPCIACACASCPAKGSTVESARATGALATARTSSAADATQARIEGEFVAMNVSW